MRTIGSTLRVVALFMVSCSPVAAQMQITSSRQTSTGTVVRKLSLLATYSSQTGVGFLGELGEVNGTLLVSALNTPDEVDWDSLDGGLTIYKAGTLPWTEGKVMEILSGALQIEIRTATKEGMLSRQAVSLQSAPGASFTSVGDKPLIDIPQSTTLVTYRVVGERWKVTFSKGKIDPKNEEPNSIVWLTKADLDRFKHSSVPISGKDGATYTIFGAYGKMEKARAIRWSYRVENGKRLIPLMTSVLPVELGLGQAPARDHAKLKVYLFLSLQDDSGPPTSEEKEKDSRRSLVWCKVVPIGLIVRAQDSGTPNEAGSDVMDTVRFRLDKMGAVTSVSISPGDKEGATEIPIGRDAYQTMTDALSAEEGSRGEPNPSAATATTENVNKEHLRTEAQPNVAQGRAKGTTKGVSRTQLTSDREAAAYHPDAMIVLIDDVTRIVHLNIGSDDRIYAGLTFSIYDKGAPIPKDGKPKAAIEVFAVTGKTAAARILSSEKTNPVAIGDVAVNLVWDSERPNRFVVVGEFDLNGDGAADDGAIDRIKMLVHKWGGVTSDTISADTNFVIIGNTPIVPPQSALEDLQADPKARDRHNVLLQKREQYEAIQSQARAFDIPVLTCERFLWAMGYKGQVGVGSPAGEPYANAEGRDSSTRGSSASTPGSLAEQFAKLTPLQATTVPVDPADANPEAVKMLDEGEKLFFEQNRLGEGITLIERALQKEPRLVRGYSTVFFYYRARKDYAAAVRWLESGTKQNPDSAPTWFNLGNAYADAGKQEEALVAFQKTLALGWPYASVYFNMGNSLGRLGRHAEAVEQFAKAVQIDSKHFGAWRAMVIAYGKLHNLAKVRETLRAMLDKGPPDEDRRWASDLLRQLPESE